MHVAAKAQSNPLNLPVGAIKTFGPVGPAYEVLRPICQLKDGDWMMAIRVLASGEEAEYKLTDILEDPEAD